MTVRRLSSKPENVAKTKPIFTFLHDYESRYGDLVQVINLENRMRELFPDDPTLSQFGHRHSTTTFDPISARPIISASQTRPRPAASYMMEQYQQQGTPTRYLDVPSTLDSPKRPFPSDDFDDDASRPRKFARAESPMLKGLGRRPETLKRPNTATTSISSPSLTQPNGGQQQQQQYRPQPSAAPLPRDVVHLLSIIPPASAYNAGRFSAEKLVDLIRRIDIPTSFPSASSSHPAGLGAQSYG
jgi:cleavage stimulation factor subunit 3